MGTYLRNDRKCAIWHLGRKLKYNILGIILFYFITVSMCFLFSGKEINHDEGFISTELMQRKTVEGKVTRISYVNESGEITYAVDKHYAILVQVKDEKGQIQREQYLDENGIPVDNYGYFAISYKYMGKKQVITYLDATGRRDRTKSGYAVVVCSFYDSGQAMDDMYYDENMNPVMCTGGYYGLHREHDKNGNTNKVVYLNSDGAPICNISGFAQEKRVFDTKGRIVKKFYFDEDGNPVCLQLGQAGESYTYDGNNRINEITYLDEKGNSIVTTEGYTILKKDYYRDGTEKTYMYYDSFAQPMHLLKGQYGIKRVEDITLYLDRNGKVMVCIDNILHGYPFMVVIAGILLCFILCLFSEKLRSCTLLAYLIFIFYETLMFRETGDARANLVLFSYAHTFLTNWRIRVDVINNIWLFIPFGTGLYAIFRKKRVWIATLGLSLAIELIQYFTGLGIAELDDLFGNTLGGVIGVGIGMVILHQIDKYQNILSDGTLW